LKNLALLKKEITDRYVQENFKRIEQAVSFLQDQNGGGGQDGQDGINGSNGADGNTILSGSGAPDNLLGNNGDFYLDLNTYEMYGPKTSGIWPLPPYPLQGSTIEDFPLQKFTDTIPASSFKNIDVTALNDFHSLSFVVTLFNDANSVSRKYNVSVLKQGATLIDEIYGRIGNLQNTITEVLVVGTDSTLKITNNNLYDLEVSFARMAL
jgi:hypothetical protein